jgi:hypothetical protein
MNTILTLDMRASKRGEKGRETWIGMPPLELQASLNAKSKSSVVGINLVGIPTRT